jgi:plastocyanin
MGRAALIGVLALGVVATPARAATVDVSVANNAFSPATVQINPGDTVRWTFAGPDTNHTTTSDSGQAESWESDPGTPTFTVNHVPGDTFSHTFNANGQFGYYCRVHTFMRGTVRVGTTSEPPPSGGGGGGGYEPPGGGSQTTPDTTAPVSGTPRVSVSRRRVSFTLNEAADVQAALRGPRTRRTLKLAGKAGTNVLKLPKRLRPGRYSLRIKATDAAGNTSTRPVVKFKVPKPRTR